MMENKEKEIQELGLKISKLMREVYNPHVRIEIDFDGVKKASADWFQPTEAKE